MAECRICYCRYTAAMTCPNCDHCPSGTSPEVTPGIEVEVLDVRPGPRQQRDEEATEAFIDRLYCDLGGERLYCDLGGEGGGSATGGAA
ncbi:MAG: hypothetical protein K2R98_28345 [Gemmataceae bacterium]|nr:hypothetical protein [Gemmataceae bacterium]